MSKNNLADVINGNYNHCNGCRFLNYNGECTKLNRSVMGEISSDTKVDNCPKKSGRYTWNK